MSQTNPTIYEIEALAKSSVMGKSHVDGFKAAYPRSKAKGNSLEVRAYEAYRNSKVSVRITEIQEQTAERANADTRCDVDEVQEGWARVFRASLDKQEDSIQHARLVITAGAEILKQQGKYDHSEHEGTTVILNQDIPGCND